MMWLQFFF